MRERDYYPAGAYNDPNAPWNEVELPYIEVDCDVTVTMTKVQRVETNNYIVDEFGVNYIEDGCADFEQQIKENEFTIPDLLKVLETYAKEELASENCKRKQYLEGLIEACQGWEMEELEVDDYTIV